MTISDDEIRFFKKVEFRRDGCWEWTAYRRDGYGMFWFNGAHVQSHRWLYEQKNGPIPDGLEPDHLCRNRECVNPDHIEPVTHAENVRRGPNWLRDKTHCKNGHPLSGKNLSVHTRKCGQRVRVCLACHQESDKKYRERKRERLESR
jgi:hypothetical protein